MAMGVLFACTYLAALVLLALHLGAGTLLERLPAAFFLQMSLFALVAGLVSPLGVPAGLPLATACDVALVVCALWRGWRPADLGRVRLADGLDCAGWALAVLAVAYCAYRQFGPRLGINFAAMDPATHFKNVRALVATGRVSGMYLTHLFCALWVEATAPLVDASRAYQVFIACEVVFLAAGTLLFFSLVKVGSSRGTEPSAHDAAPVRGASAEGGGHRHALVLAARAPYGMTVPQAAVCLVLPVLYLVGYPLNGAVFGFSYLGVGVSLIACVLWLFAREDALRDARLFYASLAVALWGLIASYALFVPVVYASVFLVLAFALRREGAGARRIALVEAGVFGLPVVMGYLLVYRAIFAGEVSVASAIATNGGAYVDLYSSFVYVAPMAIYGLVTLVARRARPLLATLTCAMLLFAGVLLALGIAGRVSAYYFFKCHYALWLLAFACAGEGLMRLAERDARMVASYAAVWLTLLAVATFGIDERFSYAHPAFSEYPAAWNNFGVTIFNRTILVRGATSHEAVELLEEYARLTEGDGERIAFVAHIDYVAWFEAIFGREAQPFCYWNMDDDQFASQVDGCRYLLVMDNPVCPITSKSGTSGEDMVERYEDAGEVVAENDYGRIVRVGERP